MRSIKNYKTYQATRQFNKTQFEKCITVYNCYQLHKYTSDMHNQVDSGATHRTAVQHLDYSVSTRRVAARGTGTTA